MKRASVQAVRLDVEAIQDDVVHLAGGEFRAVLEVGGTPNPVEDDGRQEAVLAGFATFLNALGYPIQILVRATPVDLSQYVASLEDRARRGLAPELVSFAHDHAVFVQALARQRTLLERRFYVVVPAETPTPTGWAALRVFRRRAHAPTETSAMVDAARRQLMFRCTDLARQLARCGLTVRRLSDLELAQLYLACWSPERASAQRIRQRLDDYTTLAVRPSRRPNQAVQAGS